MGDRLCEAVKGSGQGGNLNVLIGEFWMTRKFMLGKGDAWKESLRRL